MNPHRNAFQIPWRHVAIAVYLGVNLGLILYQPWNAAFDADWALWSSLVIGGNPFRNSADLLPYVWSPFTMPVMVAAAALPIAWALAHLAAVVLARDWLFVLLMLCSWGFWTDVAGGNTFTFSVVSGLLAWRGSRPAALIYLLLMFLMPRPIQVPLAATLLVKMPEVRLPATLLFVAHAIVIAPYIPDWVTNMVSYTQETIYDLGPRVFVGDAWLFIGFVIGAGLTFLGRPGWAGLFASAYWLPQYFLMPLIELRSKDHPRGPLER